MAQPPFCLLILAVLSVYLFEDWCEVPAPVPDVPVESPAQSDVGVGVHEDLHVQEIQHLREEFSQFWLPASSKYSTAIEMS